MYHEQLLYLWEHYTKREEKKEEVCLGPETVVGQTRLDDFVPPVRNVIAEILFVIFLGISAAFLLHMVARIPEVRELLSLFFPLI